MEMATTVRTHPTEDEQFLNWISLAAQKEHSESLEMIDAERRAKIRDDFRKGLEALLNDDLRAVAEKAPSTMRTYLGDLKRFKAFCDLERMPSRPAAPELVAAFLHSEAERGIGMAHITRMHSAISFAHKDKDIYDPTGHILVRAMMFHIKRHLTFKQKEN